MQDGEERPKDPREGVAGQVFHNSKADGAIGMASATANNDLRKRLFL